MYSANNKRNITSASKEVDIYSGFTKNLSLLDETVHEDEGYQNALKVSSYGKRNTTTPKMNWVRKRLKKRKH